MVTEWCNPLPLIGPAMWWSAMAYNYMALVANILRMVQLHRYLIMTATLAALR